MDAPARDEGRAVRRILVAIDSSSHSYAALEAAMHLAMDLQAEVHGLFVEDASLLLAADMGGAAEVGMFSGVTRPFGRDYAERQLRAAARAAERALAASAGPRVSWTFSVTRGEVAGEVLAAAREADLVSVGSHGWRMAGRRRVGSTVRAVLHRTSCSVLVMREGARLAPPVMVVHDGSPSGAAGLQLGRMLAETLDDTMIVVAVDDGTGDTVGPVREAVAALSGIDVRLVRVLRSDPEAVAAVARSLRCGILVLPSDVEWLTDAMVDELARGVPCPVVLARPRPAPEAAADGAPGEAEADANGVPGAAAPPGPPARRRSSRRRKPTPEPGAEPPTGGGNGD